MTSTDLKSTAEGGRGPKLSTTSVDLLADALRQGSYGSFEAKSPFAACLFPWLQALKWRGSLRELFESLPHFADTLDLAEVQNVMAVLGYPTHAGKKRQIKDIDERLMPCMFLMEDGSPCVLLEKTTNGVLLFNGQTGESQEFGDISAVGTPYFIAALEDKLRGRSTVEVSSGSWFLDILKRFEKPIRRTLLLTFVMNIMALSVPLFILAVYDQVVPIRATDILLSLSAGMALAFIFDFAFRILRARLIAYVGGRVENLVAVNAFTKILNLPPNMTEQATLGDQVSKIKDFDSLRDIFTSVLVTVGFELPFVVVFLVVLSLIAGPLVFVPIGMIALYVLIWMILSRRMRLMVKRSSQARARRHGFLVETISNLRTIKEASVEDVWLERYRNRSADAAMTSHEAAQISFLFQTLAQTVMTLSGVVTLAVGLNMAISGAISIGGLIASMALVWRVLAPIQNLFLTLTRAEQTKIALGQIDALMKLKEEPKRNNQTSGVERRWNGDITFNRVSFKYTQQSEPALLGVSFSVKQGELLAVSGSNGSGKSSTVRLLLGLSRPQAGQISIDGIDIRQIVPSELRGSMAYVPQLCKLFHGTISQNIRLGNPVASDDQILEACRMAGMEDDLAKMPRGLETRMGDQNIWQMNSGLRQKISLARAYVADAPIILMDEPANALDDQGDKVFMETLKSLKGNKTVIMVSHRPSHIRLADQLVMLHRGTVRDAGKPDDVLNRMAGGA